MKLPYLCRGAIPKLAVWKRQPVGARDGQSSEPCQRRQAWVGGLGGPWREQGGHGGTSDGWATCTQPRTAGGKADTNSLWRGRGAKHGWSGWPQYGLVTKQRRQLKEPTVFKKNGVSVFKTIWKLFVNCAMLLNLKACQPLNICPRDVA